MEQSSSYDELTVMYQFDRKCKLALEGERIDYERHIMYRRKHEIRKCPILMRSDTKLPQPFASWSNSL